MNKIIVTGVLGNVGGYVAKYLLEKNVSVVLADINVDEIKKRFGKAVEAKHLDFTDSSTFEDVLREVDRVFIIRPPHIGDPKQMKPFINQLHPNKIKLITFLSLIGIEKNPIPPHYKIEKYIEQSGCHYCHIRPSFFMQNISGVHAFEIKYLDTIVVPVKKAKTSFIDAEDIGKLIAEVMINYQNHINQGYSITGPKALDYYEVADILSETLGRKITYSNPKPSFAKKYWIDVRAIDKKYATVMGLLYMMTRIGTAKKVTNTFENIMKKKPSSFQEFVLKNKESWMLY